ncbi:MAG: gliding motility-associated C-terminal domain-containing protein [Bacteroidota bacterium]
MKTLTLIRSLMVILTISFCQPMFGQATNDECLIATFIDDVADFCSGESAFSNVGSTSSADPVPGCWGQGYEEADVWFSFRPRAGGLLIRLFGERTGSSNTLDNSALAVYTGSCFGLEEVLCSDVNEGQQDILERQITDVTIGATYHVRVSSAALTAGTFELCIQEFNPVPVPESDCPTSVVLCDKSGFFIENLNSIGDLSEELGGCLAIGGESASAWYTWVAATTGSLTFTLTPTSPDPQEDLDFVVYRLPNGVNDCSSREIVRCMATGEGIGDGICFGPTGLRAGASDISEEAGCQDGDDSFLAPLDMVAGESYALVVNNFSQSGFGFTIEFGGTGEFLGPEPDFDIIAIDGFACDQVINFRDLSVANTDQIATYEWNFGEGAVPQTATGPGPHDVIYETFGDKLAALTITTERGCQVTDITDVSIERCCMDNTLTVDAQLVDALCPGEQFADIALIAGSGTPFYLYSVDGSPFLANNVFTDLTEGSYNLSIEDAKGCIGTGTFEITPVPEVTLVLTADMDTVLLGEGTSLLGVATPANPSYIYRWSPDQGLSCIDCPNPDVVPPGQTTYTLTVIDEDGCETSEDITLFTNDIKNVYLPNAISLNAENALNERFRLFGNVAIQTVEFINVYDRWGNLVYEETNVDINQPSYLGWDGTFDGEAVSPGTYVWVTKIRFFDGEERTIAGDVMIFE